MDNELANIRREMAVLQRADRVFDAMVLFALFDSGVLGHLAGGPMALLELQARIGGNAAMLEATLEAGVALGLLRRDGDRYHAEPDLVDCLGRPGSPGYIGESVALLHSLVRPMIELGAAVRQPELPAAIAACRTPDAEPTRRMTAAMDAYARTRGRELVDRIDFSGAAQLLDVGCGPGTYAMAILERHPSARATLLDLAGPIGEAQRQAVARGLADRVTLVVGDARTWEPSTTFDTVLISNTLHMLGPNDAQALVAKAHGFLGPGGRLVVQAQFLDEGRTSPRWPVLLNLIQHLVTERGRNHTVGETRGWLQRAGFVDVRHVPFSIWNVCSAVVGVRR